MARFNPGTDASAPSTGRVYVVFENGAAVALVRANSQATAIRHVVKDRFEATPADQDHLITHLGAGMKVQTAGEDA